MRPLHVGTSGWVYGHWRGTFYPGDLPQKEWLAYYAERFDTVEINNTYYKLPTRAAIDGWLATVPADFSFVMKAHRRVTHLKRLADREALDTFLDAIAPMGERAGLVLFQLPPYFGFDAERLDRFLGWLPQASPHRFALEVRNPTWVNEQTFEILGLHGVAHVIHDLDPPTPIEVTSDDVYVRFHGPAGPYRGRYTLESLAEWARRVRGWLDQERRVWTYFNNDQAAFAAHNALELRRLLSDGVRSPAHGRDALPAAGRARGRRAPERGG